MNEIVALENLKVRFGSTAAVRGISFSIRAGQILALVGESGSGKSVTAQSLLRLTESADVTADKLTLDGHDLLTASQKELQRLRGGVAGMVFQDPMTCLNPTMRIGEQITERLRRKEGYSRERCKAEAIRLLELVQISDAALRAAQYPHQLSGGMRQRVMIAMALACQPRLLIADEPTTALDVTTQLQILKLLAEIREKTGTALLLITHDLGVVANLADRVAVMHAGRIVEQSDVRALFDCALHPYTQALLTDLTAESSDADTFLEGFAAQSGGCPFAERCAYRMRICLRQEPPLLPQAGGRSAACWRLHENAPKEVADGKIT